MRAVAVSVWIFINLVFFGMCGYIYLLWSQYWHYISRRQQQEQAQVKVDNRPLVDYYQSSEQEQTLMEILHLQREAMRVQTTKDYRRRSRPRFRGHGGHKFSSNCHNCDEATAKRLSAFKNRLIIRLRSVLHDESNVFKSKQDNPYNVQYHGLQRSSNIPRDQLLCRLREILPSVPTITGKEPAFSDRPLEYAVPNRPLLGPQERFSSCAIVSNAGALNSSGLGRIIDSHELVLRFNHAPTKGFEDDVGKKTTIRILNSQVVSRAQFQFLKSDMYSGIKILVWDPCNYTSTLEQWRDKPDFDVFTPYVKHRELRPDTNIHLVNPKSLWTLWDFIQSHTPVRIRRNPPSSGFLGLALLLPHCDKVRLFEYIPSVRLTPHCHYFDSGIDTSCTFGVWHPLAAEKLLTLNLNQEDDYTTFQTGYVTVSGYSTINC
ncbi:beta-galactoside alpha-2,6-sialyltransferase 1 isoform X1 [Halyomorpha halys]|uniref:beta-galactoside alpha-2,6-sialyltransferase 1 isoform X1 n=1 Tax=Halyomorpha halys TaxID=286706 RepID=UPI0006D4CBF8|nr:beta-galactoside alpha-2,6-sialyltransferase 1 isoform X1 [Halyomorpha halys]